MTAWLSTNLGVSFTELLALLGLLGSVIVNIYLVRDRHAARTIALNNATIKNLETSLAIERAARADSESNAERAEHDNKSRQIELEIKGATIDKLHGEISDLKKTMEERPSLVAWGLTEYREAFPADPEHPIFYCAACWSEKRIVSPRKRTRDGNESCTHWRESWHMAFMKRTANM